MRARMVVGVLVIGAIVASSCSAARDERGGPGADGAPSVLVACAEEEPDCGDILVDGDLPTGGEDPAAPPSVDDEPMSSGMIVDPLSIADAVGSEGAGVIAVAGYVVIVDGSAQFCDALAESYPPQCGGDSIDITNPEAAGGLPLLEEGTTQWSPEPVMLLGEVGSAGFTIDPTSL